MTRRRISGVFWVPLLALGCASAVEPASDDAVGGSSEALRGHHHHGDGGEGWGADDERGNGNTQDYSTRLRCALAMANPRSRVYEIGHELSATMPQSPFGDAPIEVEALPTFGLGYTAHAGNGEILRGGLGSQGTQMDAIGHFGYLDTPWDPAAESFPVDAVHYYNGFTQAEVKPDPNGPLERLGIENAPPIVTSAVILDAERYFARSLGPGEQVTAADIEGMLATQGLGRRGILRGDAVYIHTGWGRLFQDPAPDPDQTAYYAEGPGLSLDAAQLLAARRIVIVGLDNPFTDPLRACQLTGACGPPAGSLPGLPFSVHHTNLTQEGIHQIQNLRLSEVAADRVSLACTMVLPLRIRGAAGSPIRPIAIGGRTY